MATPPSHSHAPFCTPPLLIAAPHYPQPRPFLNHAPFRNHAISMATPPPVATPTRRPRPRPLLRGHAPSQQRRAGPRAAGPLPPALSTGTPTAASYRGASRHGNTPHPHHLPPGAVGPPIPHGFGVGVSQVFTSAQIRWLLPHVASWGALTRRSCSHLGSCCTPRAYTRMHTCIHTCTYTHAHLHTCMHTCTHTQTRTPARTHRNAGLHAQA